jgi:hypothetical protein
MIIKMPDKGIVALAGLDPCSSRDSAWRYEGFTKASQLSANIPLANAGTAMMDVGTRFVHAVRSFTRFVHLMP